MPKANQEAKADVTDAKALFMHLLKSHKKDIEESFRATLDTQEQYFKGLLCDAEEGKKEAVISARAQVACAILTFLGEKMNLRRDTTTHEERMIHVMADVLARGKSQEGIGRILQHEESTARNIDPVLMSLIRKAAGITD